MDNQYMSLTFVGIVAVVAIFGIVYMQGGSSSAAPMSQSTIPQGNMAGNAIAPDMGPGWHCYEQWKRTADGQRTTTTVCVYDTSVQSR